MLRSAQAAMRAYASQHLLLFVWGYVPYLRGFSEVVWKGGFSVCSGVFLLSEVLLVLMVLLKFMFSPCLHKDSLLLCTEVFVKMLGPTCEEHNLFSRDSSAFQHDLLLAISPPF